MGGRGATSSQVSKNIVSYMSGYKASDRSPDDWNNIEGRKKWMSDEAQENEIYAKQTKQTKRTRFTGHVVDDLEAQGVKVSSNIYDKAKAEKNKINAKGDDKVSRELREAHKESRSSIIEKGVKPHLEVINKQIAEMKVLYPSLDVKNIVLSDLGSASVPTKLSGNTLYINERMLSIPRINSKVAKIGSVAKDYNDYLTGVLSTSVLSSLRSSKNVKIQTALKQLETNYNKHYSKNAISIFSTRDGFDSAFREALTQQVMYRKGRTTSQHPMAQDINELLKLVRKEERNRSKRRRG